MWLLKFTFYTRSILPKHLYSYHSLYLQLINIHTIPQELSAALHHNPFSLESSPRVSDPKILEIHFPPPIAHRERATFLGSQAHCRHRRAK